MLRLRSVTIHLDILYCLFRSVLRLNVEHSEYLILNIIFGFPSFSALRIPFPVFFIRPCPLQTHATYSRFFYSHKTTSTHEHLLREWRVRKTLGKRFKVEGVRF